MSPQDVSRLVAMLASAAKEPEWQVKWARVNRAAGILVGIVGLDCDAQEAAAQHAEEIANIIAEALVGVLEPTVLSTMVQGLAKRAASALVEFYALPECRKDPCEPDGSWHAANCPIALAERIEARGRA